MEAVHCLPRSEERSCDGSGYWILDLLLKSIIVNPYSLIYLEVGHKSLEFNIHFSLFKLIPVTLYLPG